LGRVGDQSAKGKDAHGSIGHGLAGDGHIHIVMKAGAFVYDAVANTLKGDVSGDYRALTGTQLFVHDAPVTLVYVADERRMAIPPDWPKEMKDATKDAKHLFKWANTAAISVNVYLFAASEGLATGIRALVDRPAPAKALKLGDSQSITMAQCVGFPKKWLLSDKKQEDQAGKKRPLARLKP
jgi:nitroreductase